ncbi:hypothetical protein [Caballeronia sp. DA-9]|uniref:hypothetical protein n=1 Tax=Caballeronia sp. DA-9 TaxID=3436237 RepID=UPI003F673B2C
METVVVASIVLVAVGAFATFAIAQLLPQEVLAKAEEHGRFAGLANAEVSAKPPGSVRRASPAHPAAIGRLAADARTSRHAPR